MSARQGVDILMALVHAELKCQFLTPCQSSNYELIEFKFLWVITFQSTQIFVSLVFGGSQVAAPGRGEIYGSCAFIIIFFGFLESRPVETR